jgi:FMN phosphatase YigB (HAD superfamily)
MENIFWEGLELVIFDVDGTLYRQSKLRKTMLFKLLCYYTLRPWKYRELLILYHFRKERENRHDYSGSNLEEEQYEWPAALLKTKPEKIKKVIEDWMYTAPNPYLKSVLYPGIAQFFTDLKQYGIKTAIYSDYKSDDKLQAMGLSADLQICSTDKRVNSFKPLPRGLLVILEELRIKQKGNCLFIGDRFELDGLCAERAGIPFLLVDKDIADINLYTELSTQLNQNRSYKKQ